MKDVVIRGAGILIVAGVLAGGGAYVVGSGGQTANLWVDANGGSCVYNASPAEYADADACGSFDAANDLCADGDTVLVKLGSYSSQSLTGSNSRTTQCTMTAAAGETVTVAGGSFNTADQVLIDGITLTDVWTFTSSSDFDTLTNATVTGTFVDFQGGTNSTYSDSVQGPCNAGPTPTYDGDCATRLIGTNQTIDGVVFHDISQSDNQPPGSNVWHTEAIFVRGCTDCVIRNSKFYNIDSSANVFVQDCCGLGNNDGLTIENNWFGPHLLSTNPGGGANTSVLCFTCEPDHIAINFAGGAAEAGNGYADVIVRFNSTYSYCDTSLSTTYLTTSGRCGGSLYCDNANLACGLTTSSAQVYGNLLGHTSLAGTGNPATCMARTTYTYNVFYPHNSVNGTGGPCPGTGNALHTSSLFPYTTQPVGAAQESTAPNYAITGAAWTGDELVPASLCDDVPTDINGDSRNDGNGCDAGADER